MVMALMLEALMQCCFGIRTDARSIHLYCKRVCPRLTTTPEQTKPRAFLSGIFTLGRDMYLLEKG